MTVNVARSLEEAELQSSGKSIQDLAAEQEQEAEFEIAELFDDIGSAALDDEELKIDQEPEVVQDNEIDTSDGSKSK